MKQWAPSALFASSLVFGVMAHRAQAQGVDPCSGQSSGTGDSEITGAGLEMPVPNTRDAWTHASGSGAHVGRDKYALDLNHNTAPTDAGLPVLASADGTVRFAAFASCGYGNTIMVEHNVAGNVFYTMYAHMEDTLLVATGDTVRQGQAMGYIGRTGTSTEHLHWSVRQDPSPRHASVNGQSTASANLSSLSLTSDTRMIWRDDFATASTWEPAPGSVAVPSIQDRQLRLPGPGTPAVVQHKKPVFVHPDNGTYRLSFAARTERLRSGLATGVALRVDCLTTATGGVQRTVTFGGTALDSRGGWTVQSFPLTFGSGANRCPAATRFIRPALVTDSSVGAEVLVDWVEIEERPSVPTGGFERLEAYAYGGLRRIRTAIQDPSSLTSVQLIGSNSRAGMANPTVIATFVTNLQANEFTLPVTSPFLVYGLRLQTASGFRDFGPTGTVASTTKVLVPGLGRTDMLSQELVAIPSWVNYPFASFDNSIDSYGIVNSTSSAVTIHFTPETPVVGLHTFSAYYGGNPTRSDVWAVDHATGNMIHIGETISPFLDWGIVSSPSWPATTREIIVVFERQLGDKNLHIDEILFN